MRKEKEEVQYIWHDGVRIREDQLVTMAMSAGTYALAEHYVCSLLAHGCMHGLTYLINKANEIREFYQVRKFPVPTMDEDSSTTSTKYRVSIEDQIRKKYRRMSPDERTDMLRACLGSLRANYPKMFRFKNQWQAIYQVIRDRLDGGLLPEYFIVQQWMGHEDRAAAWMARGGRVICSDTKCWYFDYPYGTIDLHHIWQYPRIPDYAKDHADQLLGLEAPLWTERITNPDRAAFMLFPRLAGLGLKAAGRDADTWEEQSRRIRELQNQIEATGVKGAPENYWYMSEEAAGEDRQADHDRIYAPDALPFVQTEEEIVLLDETERFMQELGIPRNLMLAAGDMIFYRQASAGPVSAGADILIRQLTEAVKSRKYGAWHRLPEDVWMDTMKCYPRFISEHRRSYGVDGFDRGEWTTRQVSARLFRLGELEYELLEEKKTAESSERCISLHIPSDAKLTPDLLNDSVKKAREFLSEYFPDWADLPMCCESWLLSPRLQEWLPESSGIIRFQNAFDIEETDSADETALEWVFYIAEGQRASMNPASFPESTSLQRRMKADYLSGGKPGSARGRLARDFA